MNLKTKLSDEFESQMDELNKLQVGSDEYKVAVDGVTKLADRIIDIQKMEAENEARDKDREIDESFKSEQVEMDKKDRRNRTVVEVLKIGVPTAAAFAMGIISMKWEKLDTLTSTAGKSSLRDLLRFK